jgi:hypothetical protein
LEKNPDFHQYRLSLIYPFKRLCKRGWDIGPIFGFVCFWGLFLELISPFSIVSHFGAFLVKDELETNGWMISGWIMESG